MGLSPRWRGNLPSFRPHGVIVGSIPALAGQPDPLSMMAEVDTVYPRAGGATCSASDAQIEGCGLSPRWRGNPQRAGLIPVNKRSIPALAGQPTASFLPRVISTVYPRAGGATFCIDKPNPLKDGLSPRWRGNPGPG